jgi:hypothetical protein
MYAMAIHVIPKPHSTNLRLISNFSTSEYMPNTMINKADISNLPLDTITKLGTTLISFCQAHGDAKLVMWKSDMLQAYCRMLIHKHWQILQLMGSITSSVAITLEAREATESGVLSCVL